MFLVNLSCFDLLVSMARGAKQLGQRGQRRHAFALPSFLSLCRLFCGMLRFCLMTRDKSGRPEGGRTNKSEGRQKAGKTKQQGQRRQLSCRETSNHTRSFFDTRQQA